MSDRTTISAMETSLAAAEKRNWRQRLFLYPTIIGALLGAIPTGLDYYKAFVYDIEFNAVRHAEEQQRLWIKNFACARDIVYQQVTTAENILVKVGACANGDVLIEAVTPNAGRIVEWISLERLKSTPAVSSLTLVGSAYASALSHFPANRSAANRPAQDLTRLAASTTKCQKLAGNTRIIRIVQENGACYREEIDLMKGKVISRRPVPCTASCG